MTFALVEALLVTLGDPTSLFFSKLNQLVKLTHGLPSGTGQINNGRLGSLGSPSRSDQALSLSFGEGW